MRSSASLFASASAALAVAIGLTGAACSSTQAADDGGGGDATADVFDNDGEPLICQQFSEAGATCATVSPVRCFACGDGGGGCYCQSTPQGPRWKCAIDPSCFPCTLGDEDCAPNADDDGGEGGDQASADATGDVTADGGGADASDARSE
jgi:hypothetical protein